jgi:hypothetical protein
MKMEILSALIEFVPISDSELDIPPPDRKSVAFHESSFKQVILLIYGVHNHAMPISGRITETLFIFATRQRQFLLG